MAQFPNRILLSQDRETGVINDYWVLQDSTDNITKEYVRLDTVCDWLNNFYSEARHCYLTAEDIKAFKEAMEEQIYGWN